MMSINVYASQMSEDFKSMLKKHEIEKQEVDAAVLNVYKTILGDETLLYEHDWGADYEYYMGDFNELSKRLVVKIYRDNETRFKNLTDYEKLEVYDAILLTGASLASPSNYGGTEAQEKLNSMPFKVSDGDLLSDLKIFFNKYGKDYDKIAFSDKDRIAFSDKDREELVQLRKDVKKEKDELKEAKDELKKAKDELKEAKDQLKKTEKFGQTVEELTKIFDKLENK